jgi:hypothetical protein
MPTVFPTSPSNGDKWASGLVWTAPGFQKKLASDISSSAAFGQSTAMSADGTTALVGAGGRFTSGVGGTGAVYAFNYSAGVWSQSQIIVSSDLEYADRFGSSVSMSANGDIAVIGAKDEDTGANSNNGAAYIFTRSAGTWTQQAKLVASDPAGSATFGSSASISSDGTTVAIGSPYSGTGGAVYVFTGSGATWTQQAKLVASDTASNDQFGNQVSISSDGSTLLIAAQNKTVTFTSNGAAYVFTRSAGTWTEQAKLIPTTLQIYQGFGSSVALSSTGNSAFIGAPSASNTGASFSGSVYYFTRSGSTWTQQQKITSSDIVAGDSFGTSVALSANGSLLLVGVYGEDTSPNTDNGAVYSFSLSGSSWVQGSKYFAPDAASYDNFGGGQISISSNGSKFIIGCYTEATSPYTYNGAVYFYDSPTYDLSTGTKYTYNAAKNLWTLDNASPVKAPTTHVFTSSQTWNIPANAKMVHTWVIGAGGGGGGGCTVSANGNASRGGSGGSGGALSRTTFNIIPGYNDTTATITIGAGGTGGAGGASGGGSGSAGTSGTASTINFSTSVDPIGPITASGGAGGAGGTQSSSSATNATQTLGMHYGSKGGRGVGGVFGSYFEDGLPSYGGAAGGGSGAGHPGTDTASRFGGAGGSVVPFSVAGGANNTLTRIGSSSLVFGPGAGGAGGTSYTSSTYIYGGAGGLYGGGGGGGGSGGRTDRNGGAGGNGAQGVVVLMVWYG